MSAYQKDHGRSTCQWHSGQWHSEKNSLTTEPLGHCVTARATEGVIV